MCSAEISSEGPKCSTAQGGADRCCQGLNPWGYFAQMNSSGVPGGLNGVSQCSVLLKCPASSGCIPMRLGKDWKKAGERCGLLMQALALIHKKKHKVVHADAFQMSECQLPLQGMLVWYLSKVLRGRFTFDCVTCPAEDFFFSPLFHDKHKSLWWSQDPFSSILTQAACCVVRKSPIFFLRKINTAHYLAEKRSLCQFHWQAGPEQAQPLFVRHTTG